MPIQTKLTRSKSSPKRKKYVSISQNLSICKGVLVKHISGYHLFGVFDRYPIFVNLVLYIQGIGVLLLHFRVPYSVLYSCIVLIIRYSSLFPRYKRVMPNHNKHHVFCVIDHP